MFITYKVVPFFKIREEFVKLALLMLVMMDLNPKELLAIIVDV
jgi:hypothetical protein